MVSIKQNSLLVVISLLGCAAPAFAFSSCCSNKLASATALTERTSVGMLSARKNAVLQSEDKSDNDCDPCKNLFEDDIELDRREAAFAMLGTVWAAGLLPATASAILFPDAAHAAFGDDANIQLPNPLQAISDRATKRCIVESLGNRECLVYAEDAANILYQGLDGQVLVERLEKATASLASLPALIEQKKWSQVTGVLTGPMGDLIRTMGQLAEISENTTGSTAARDKIKSTKSDLYAIAAAVDRRDGTTALKFHAAATNDLVAFVKSL